MNNVIPSVKELGDGKYSVSFTPVALGDHVVSIRINGMHIFKSPIKDCIEEAKEFDIAEERVMHNNNHLCCEEDSYCYSD